VSSDLCRDIDFHGAYMIRRQVFNEGGLLFKFGVLTR